MRGYGRGRSRAGLAARTSGSRKFSGALKAAAERGRNQTDSVRPLLRPRRFVIGTARTPGRLRGFTILELLVAVVMVAIVAAVAIPVHFARPEVTLENACILLARDLRAAQNRAAYEGDVSVVTFDEDGGGYSVTNSVGTVIDHPRTDGPFVRRYDADAVFDGVHVRMVDTGNDRSLVYDERGFALEAGRIVLTFGGDAREVLVARDTGDVTILGSTSGWVDRGF